MRNPTPKPQPLPEDELAESRAAVSRRTEERHRALIENSFDVITVFDTDGTIRYTTPSCRRVLGYQPEELIGRPGHELVHPDDLEEANRVFQAIQGAPGKRVTLSYRVRHKNGEYRTVEIHGTNLLDHPAVRGMVSNLRDITEREDAAAALRRSEAQYRELVDQAVFGIYRSTLDGRLLAVNPALVEMLGFGTSEELLAVNMETLYADPDERDRRVRRHARSGQPFSVETQWKRRDGTPITVRLSGRPVDAGADMPAGFEVAVEDVSQQHALEEALRQSQKMEAVGRLAGGVAHDFNNLLTVILGETEMALRSGAGTPAIDRSLERIQESAERAAAQTQQLLSFSRRELVKFETLDLNQLVTGASHMLRRLIEENVRLDLDLEDGLWEIRGDRSQLELLLVNLVVNGRDAMPDGGRLSISTSRSTVGSEQAVAGSELKPGEYALLRVSDTGHGMSEDVRAHAFEPFFSTKADLGTGLGLAACYRVATRHGGQIDLASEEGRGTTVSVYLPRGSADELPAPAAKVRQAARGSETILLVEDEQAVREVTARMLEKAGYTVLPVADGSEALRLVEERGDEISLLVTDLVLAGLNGRQLADRILETHPRTRVLYVSGYTDDSIMRGRVDGEEVQLVRKPYGAEELAARVREVLDAE